MWWLYEHGFTLLQTFGIVAGLFFTGWTIRMEARERRIENLFLLAAAHREIWSTLYQKPELARVLQTDFPDGPPEPTLEERIFVRSLILHLSASFQARRYGMYFNESGLAADVRQFFAKPIPRAVWRVLRGFQEADFVLYMEAQGDLRDSSSGHTSTAHGSFRQNPRKKNC